MNKLEYIFIDLDGTILEGKFKHYNCYKDIINQDGGDPLDIDIYWDMKRHKITRDIQLNKSNYRGSYNNFLSKWLENIENKQYLSYDILKPDVIDTLVKWKKHTDKLILITMRNNKENLYWQLDKLNIKSLFDDIIICRCVDNTKKYDFVKDYEFNKAIVIGDTEHDIQLAIECKVKCIAITNGLRDKEFLDSDFIAEEINEIDLAEVINKIYLK